MLTVPVPEGTVCPVLNRWVLVDYLRGRKPKLQFHKYYAY